MPRDDLTAGRGVQHAGHGLRDIGDFTGLLAERGSEVLQVVAELRDVTRHVSDTHTGQPALRVDGELEGDVRALDRDLAALSQLGHSEGLLSSWCCLDRDYHSALLRRNSLIILN